MSPDWFGRDMLTVVGVFELCWRDVPEVAEEAVVVEPIDPFEGSEFEVIEALAGPLVVDQFGLVAPEHLLSQGVVVEIAA